MKFQDFYGKMIYINGETSKQASQISWTKHPAFDGVFTKNLLSSAESGKAMTVLMVKLDPGKELGLHTHDGNTELHEVLEGDGKAIISGKEVSYSPGILSLIPANQEHSVRAGKNGMVLLAKFTPPL